MCIRDRLRAGRRPDHDHLPHLRRFRPDRPAQTPVSYTHLDVYKRQAPGSPMRAAPPALLCRCQAHHPTAHSAGADSAAGSGFRTATLAGPAFHGARSTGGRARCARPYRQAVPTSTVGSDARAEPDTTLATRRFRRRHGLARLARFQPSRSAQLFGSSRLARCPTSCRSCGGDGLGPLCRRAARTSSR